MSATPFLFADGDSLTIAGDDGKKALWTVQCRRRGGYLLQPSDGADARTWLDEDLLEAYCSKGLVHYPFNIDGLPRSRADVVEKTWEHWSPKVRREAERRQTYLQTVDAIWDEHPTAMAAYSAAATHVFSRFADEWRAEDLLIIGAELERQRRRTRGRQSSDLVADIDDFVRRPPSAHTIRLWYLSWRRFGRDIRLLIPLHHKKGNRKPRRKRASGSELDAYKLMDVAIERSYATAPRRKKKFAYGVYISLCAESGIKPFSLHTFCKRIGSKYTDYEEYALRYGRRAAYLKFGVFERRELPGRPLEEVEIDHCLIDIFVTHPVTGKVLGRPWMTVLLDRATRVIVGFHLSFEVPSYASLQRAMAHAFWPKDLSTVTGLEDDWPVYGIPDWLITDNGREFRSRSLRESERHLNFNVVNLPVKMPWLKGAVERLFQTIGVQVFSHAEGTTLSRTPDFYHPTKRAEHSLDQIRLMLVRWIINDYHRTRHTTLGCAPIAKWRELTQRYPVRPVPDFEHIVRLTGEVLQRKISNVGIHYEGLLYSDKDELIRLRSSRGGLAQEWTIRVDPYDLGEAWILDVEGGRWLSLPCTNQGISRGVSKFQHRIHRATARRLKSSGSIITEDDLLEARRMCEEQAIRLLTNGRKTGTVSRAARYFASGEPATQFISLPPLSPAPETPALDLGEFLQDPPQVSEIPDLSAEVGALVAAWKAGPR
ncbi:MAG: putative transposase [Pseudoalteromonas distincta]|jgi:putative transposase